MKMWFLSRHSTRFPGKKIVEGMFNTLPKIRDQLQSQEGNPCYNDALKMWAPPSELAKGQTRNLTPHGRISSFLMGQRFRKRLSDFIPGRLDSRNFSKETAHHFLVGLFGEVPEEQSSQSKEVDPYEDKFLKVEFQQWSYLTMMQRLS